MPYVEEFCEHICVINQGEIVLNGKIKDIKRAYPRNRINISPERDADSFLIELTAKEGWKDIALGAEKKGDDLEITLKRAEDKSTLLKMLTALPIGIESMQVVEPTLEEIFVDKVGESN
jgi:ABC-2 type transport system ATP-binding protein